MIQENDPRRIEVEVLEAEGKYEEVELSKNPIINSPIFSSLSHNSMGELTPTSNPFLAAIDPDDRDLISELLGDKRSANTRRAYQKDLKYFFKSVVNNEPTPQLVAQFLSMPRAAALSLVLKYKQEMISKDLAEATINRRLAALRALVDYARKIDKCTWTLADIKGERIQSYRDTSGVDPDAFKKMLLIPNLNTIKGLRDYALLLLLWSNALRRSEIAQLNLEDLDLDAKRIWILGKGKGSQKTPISLTPKTIEAIQNYLSARGKPNPKSPLFTNVVYSPTDRLTPDGIYKIVRDLAAKAGISKILSPHRIRHSSITAALDASGGDVRKVQRLSRHAKLDTLMIYDDNRRNAQGEISSLLEDLL